MAARTLLFILMLFVVFTPKGQNKSQTPAYIRIYKYAEQLYAQAANDREDSLALQSYHKVISLLRSTSSNDSILFDSYVKAAILEMSHQQVSASLRDFLASITLYEKKRGIRDTTLFKSYLYTGSIYYSLNNLDSALYYYQRAEPIVEAFPVISESERLYNKLGALYFETGD